MDTAGAANFAFVLGEYMFIDLRMMQFGWREGFRRLMASGGECDTACAAKDHTSYSEDCGGGCEGSKTCNSRGKQGGCDETDAKRLCSGGG